MMYTEAQAQLCPVCKGEGWLQSLPPYSTTKPIDPRKCRGCSGRGWVTVQIDYKVRLSGNSQE